MGYVIRSVRGSGQGTAESGDVLGERSGLSEKSGLGKCAKSGDVLGERFGLCHQECAWEWTRNSMEWR